MVQAAEGGFDQKGRPLYWIRKNLFYMKALSKMQDLRIHPLTRTLEDSMNSLQKSRQNKPSTK